MSRHLSRVLRPFLVSHLIALREAVVWEDRRPVRLIAVIVHITLGADHSRPLLTITLNVYKIGVSVVFVPRGRSCFTDEMVLGTIFAGKIACSRAADRRPRKFRFSNGSICLSLGILYAVSFRFNNVPCSRENVFSLVFFVHVSPMKVIIRILRLGIRRGDEYDEKAGAKDADAGGLKNLTQPEGFLNGADAFLLRPGGKKVLKEGNDSFGGFFQKPVFFRSAYGSGRAVLPQDGFRKAQEPRRLG